MSFRLSNSRGLSADWVDNGVPFTQSDLEEEWRDESVQIGGREIGENTSLKNVA
jgi:hypothetical protein